MNRSFFFMVVAAAMLTAGLALQISPSMASGDQQESKPAAINSVDTSFTQRAESVPYATDSTLPVVEYNAQTTEVVSANWNSTDFVSQLGGIARIVGVQGNYAYILGAGKFTVLDISNPLAPVEVGVRGGIRHEVADYNQAIVHDDLVLVVGTVESVETGQTGYVQIINIRNPTEPLVGGYLALDSPITGIGASGDYAFLLGAGAGMYVIDIGNYLSPVQKTFQPYERAASIAVVGPLVYVHTYHHWHAEVFAGVWHLIDITNPTQPYGIRYIRDRRGLDHAVIIGNYLYTQYGVHDVSEPLFPQWLDNISSGFGSNVRSTVHNGNHLYATRADSWNSWLAIIDVTSPESPTLVTENNLAFEPYQGMSVVGDYVLISDTTGRVRVLDTSDKTAPVDTNATYDALARSMDVAAADEYIYSAHPNGNELNIVDVSNPSAPRVVGTANLIDGAHKVVVSGNYAYVAASNGLYIVDITNKAAPYLIGKHTCGDFGCNGYDLAIKDQTVYMTSTNQGVLVIDVSDKANPGIIGQLPPYKGAWTIAINGDFAYVWVSGSIPKLYIIDTVSLSVLGSVDVPGQYSGYGMTVANDHAYVGVDDSGLAIVDVSDPSAPRFVRTMPLGKGVRGVEAVGNHLFVSNGVAGLRILDIDDPEAPIVVGQYSTGGFATNVAVAGDMIYVADDVGGLEILRLSEGPQTYSISGIVLDQSYAPISGVEICIQGGTCSSTYENGRYTIPSLAAGNYTLSASKSDIIFTPLQRTVAVPPGNSNIDFIHICSAAKNELQPLLLVPGWGGPDTIDGDENGFKQIKPYLNSLGWIEGCNLFFAGNTSPHNAFEHNQKNAGAISNHLRSAYPIIQNWYPEWDGHFDIIGHSYGGLNARFYLEGKYNNGRSYYDSDKSDPELTPRLTVDNLFTLGSPHGGSIPVVESYLGATWILKDHLDWSQRGSVFQLLNTAMDTYNLRSRQPADICYHLIGGNFLLQPDLYLKAPGIAALYADTLGSPNDIGVSIRSSLNLRLSSIYGLQYRIFFPNVEIHATSDMHGYVDQLGLDQVHSYVHLSDTFANYIIPVSSAPKSGSLGNNNPCDSSNSATNMVDISGFQARSELTTEQAEPILSSAGSLGGGQTISPSVIVDASGKWAFYTTSTGGPINLTLNDPSGGTITPATADADPDIDYIDLSDSSGSIVADIISDTQTGSWQMVLSNPGTDTITYQAYAVTQSSLVLTLDTTTEHRANQLFTITAMFADSGQPVTGAIVDITITHPNDSDHVVLLRDDGLAPDSVANDGVYSGTYSGANIAGNYWAVAQASGSVDGRDYFRTAQGVIRVAPDTVSLQQVESDTAADPGSSGLYESLAVAVSLTATEPLTVTLSAVLQNAAGEYIDLASTTAETTVGVQTMTLRFSGEAIRRAGFDGPYTVTEVSLVDSNLMIQADELAGEYLTGPYDHGLFGIQYRPDMPWGPQPAHESPGVAATTMLSWSAADPNPYDTVTYDIHLDTINPPVNLVASNQTTSSFDPPSDLLPGTTYYWQVIAHDSSGLQTAGPVWSFTTTATAAFTLQSGWNMVSSHVQPGNPAVSSVLAGIVDDVVLMKNGDGQVYWPAFGINEIGDWDVTDGYQIYMSNPTALAITGTAVDPSATPIPLIAGWNMAAYLLDSPLAIDQALASIDGALYLAKNGDGQVYWPAFGVNQIGEMQPGQGYQLYMSNAGTLVYPGN